MYVDLGVHLTKTGEVYLGSTSKSIYKVIEKVRLKHYRFVLRDK